MTVSKEEKFPSLCGKFLVAMPGMGDARFEKSVVYICAHSVEGAMGFVINQTLDSPSVSDFLAQLEIISKDEQPEYPVENIQSKVHSGGPVEPGRGFVLHSPDFDSSSTVKVQGDVCLTATLEVLREIAIGKGPKLSLLALGYSGWSAGQLESEIVDNGWLVSEADERIIFDQHNDTKYTRTLKLMGIDEGLLSATSGHA
jgi:putative transcriptional regulator